MTGKKKLSDPYTSFFERSPGHLSMMRLLAFMGFILGSLIAVWGMYLLTKVVLSAIAGTFEVMPLVGSIAIVVAGGGALAGGGQALKVVQQRGEVREAQVKDGKTNK